MTFDQLRDAAFALEKEIEKMTAPNHFGRYEHPCRDHAIKLVDALGRLAMIKNQAAAATKATTAKN